MSLYGAAARADGSVVLTGWTSGDWGGALSGDADLDFIALALGENGTEIWRWQVQNLVNARKLSS